MFSLGKMCVKNASCWNEEWSHGILDLCTKINNDLVVVNVQIHVYCVSLACNHPCISSDAVPTAG